MTDDERPPRSFLAERLATRKGRRPRQRQEDEEGQEEPPPRWFSDALRNRRTSKAPFRLFDNNQPPDAAA